MDSVRNSTYLKLLSLSLDLGLLVFTREVRVPVAGVRLLDLTPHGVDLRLELVLLVLGIRDKLVFGDHLALLLRESVLLCLIEGRGAGGNGQVTHAHLLLDLASLRCRCLVAVGLVVSVHGLEIN